MKNVHHNHISRCLLYVVLAWASIGNVLANISNLPSRYDINSNSNGGNVFAVGLPSRSVVRVRFEIVDYQSGNINLDIVGDVTTSYSGNQVVDIYFRNRFNNSQNLNINHNLGDSTVVNMSIVNHSVEIVSDELFVPVEDLIKQEQTACELWANEVQDASSTAENVPGAQTFVVHQKTNYRQCVYTQTNQFLDDYTPGYDAEQRLNPADTSWRILENPLQSLQNHPVTNGFVENDLLIPTFSDGISGVGVIARVNAEHRFWMTMVGEDADPAFGTRVALPLTDHKRLMTYLRASSAPNPQVQITEVGACNGDNQTQTKRHYVTSAEHVANSSTPPTFTTTYCNWRYTGNAILVAAALPDASVYDYEYEPFEVAASLPTLHQSFYTNWQPGATDRFHCEWDLGYPIVPPTTDYCDYSRASWIDASTGGGSSTGGGDTGGGDTGGGDTGGGDTGGGDTGGGDTGGGDTGGGDTGSTDNSDVVAGLNDIEADVEATNALLTDIDTELENSNSYLAQIRDLLDWNAPTTPQGEFTDQADGVTAARATFQAAQTTFLNRFQDWGAITVSGVPYTCGSGVNLGWVNVNICWTDVLPYLEIIGTILVFVAGWRALEIVINV